jgi:hypothetical protein
MSALNYGFHADKYKDLLASPNDETRYGAEVSALTDHQLAVQTELFNFPGEVIATSLRLSHDRAKHYTQFGVGRRLRMIFAAYQRVFSTVAADRTEPLHLNEMASVSNDLNMIYINLRGALDNYAWAIYFEKDLPKTKKLTDMEVGLFNNAFRNHKTVEPLKPTLDGELDWNSSLKSRRDPSAHRMPLYVPPAVLNEEQAARHQAIWAERTAAIENGEFEKDNELAEEQSKLGTFTPHFMHDPTGEGLPIYKTIPEDAGKLITLGRSLNDFLLK